MESVCKNPEFPSGTIEGPRKVRGGASEKTLGPQLPLQVQQLHFYLIRLPQRALFC